MLFRFLEEEAYSMWAEVLPMDTSSRRRAIEKAAYLLAEKRGFAPGHELDDWLMAERQCDAWERRCSRYTH
jgi:hypothetical protein